MIYVISVNLIFYSLYYLERVTFPYDSSHSLFNKIVPTYEFFFKTPTLVQTLLPFNKYNIPFTIIIHLFNIILNYSY